jgi:hypothetical protein
MKMSVYSLLDTDRQPQNAALRPMLSAWQRQRLVEHIR